MYERWFSLVLIFSRLIFQTFRKAIATVRASNRFRQSTGIPGTTNPEVDELMKVLEAGQAEAAAESETVNEVLATWHFLLLFPFFPF
jgi:hypothetical protein